MSTRKFPVIHNGNTVVIETDAPDTVIIDAFECTHSPVQLIGEVTNRGYNMSQVKYGFQLNYDKK